ncbi:MAG: Ig-like domain-containing protein [Pleurocapsa sp.]
MNFKNSSLFLTTIALTFAATFPANANFSFSDFNFHRHNNSATEFHTTEYTNEDGSNAGQGVNAFQQFVREEASAIDLDELNARRLDGTKLSLIQDIEDLKVYFIHEGAGYRNQLKIKTTGTTSTEGLIFVDGSMGNSSEQLQSGDYVSLGEIKAGSTLDFSLLANGYQNSSFYTYFAGIDRNPDRIQHVMAYQYQKDYLVLAWEDLYEGGDKDYNDIVFAIYIGEENLDSIPEDLIGNQAPMAVTDRVETPYGENILIDVMANDSDPDGDTFTIEEVDGFLSEGTVVVQEGKVLYTPNRGTSGNDTFNYTIVDAKGAEASTAVTVIVGEAPKITLYAD